MDRIQAYRNQIPFESDIMQVERDAYEALGLFMRDVLGVTTSVAGLPCTPTSPASLSVKVGPGRIYSLQSLEATPIGQLLGTGGLAADVVADHQILKQGLLRDTATFALTPPGTTGQSINYLIQATFQQADDADVTTQFYNTANPNAPISNSVSPARRDKCILSLKAGTAATTGSQVTPSADAGYVPVWVITVAYGATTITAGNIVASPSAPFISVGGGGGGGGGSGLSPWQTITSTYTAVAGDRLIANTTGGPFTVNLPLTPSDGDECTVRVPKGAINALTLGRNGKNTPDVNGSPTASDIVVNQNNVEIRLVFSTDFNMWTASS